MSEQPQPYEVGDRIEHVLVPGFWMTVLDTKDCETPDHRAYKIVDFTGREDWLCAYDVRREDEESPANSVNAWMDPSGVEPHHSRVGPASGKTPRDNVRLAVSPGQ